MKLDAGDANLKKPKNYVALGLIAALSWLSAGGMALAQAISYSPGGSNGGGGSPGGSNGGGGSPGGSNGGGGLPGGSMAAHPLALPDQPTLGMPTLPPGTRPSVAQAVQNAFKRGDLTNRQAAAVSDITAPLYNPNVFRPIAGTDYTGYPVTPATYGTTALSAGVGQPGMPFTGDLTEQNIANINDQNAAVANAPPAESVVDFGSAAAAQAAVDAYMAKLKAETGITF